eukprot:gene14852-10844_t
MRYDGPRPPHFFQTIEGPPGAVAGLLSRLRRDGRHHEVDVVERTAVTRRLHPRWAMDSLMCEENWARKTPGSSGGKDWLTALLLRHSRTDHTAGGSFEEHVVSSLAAEGIRAASPAAIA